MKLDALLHSFGTTVIGGVLSMFLGFAPFAVMMWTIVRRKRQFRAEFLEPFTDLPLRSPGESLRLKIDDLQEEFESDGIALLFGGIFFGLLIYIIPAPIRLMAFMFGALALAGAYAYYCPKILRKLREIWNYKLGLKGECAVGQELNQLVADGFQVFHDLPFDGFNIDHVLVGPAGVWVVETKTRRKPAALKGLARATVVYDGRTLQFPWGTDTHGLDQAERNAKTLSQWLTASTGEATSVNSMLVLPGWWVERKARGAVTVLNSKEIRRAFPTHVARPLLPDRIRRIAFQLTERCRIAQDH
jgi:hypothetical protein